VFPQINVDDNTNILTKPVSFRRLGRWGMRQLWRSDMGRRKRGGGQAIQAYWRADSDLLRKHQPERWSFAAVSEINPGSLEQIAPEWRECLTRNY
jgi:hypothetical protein